MAFEERLISFYLDEIHQMLLDDQSSIDPSFKKGLKKLSIIGVEHTSTIHSRPSQKARYEEVMELPSQEAGTLFYCTQTGLWDGKNYGFFLSDEELVVILADGCIDKGIKIPRKGERSVVSSDFHISLKIKLTGEAPYDLEDPIAI